jgi:hypothetical protein
MDTGIVIGLIAAMGTTQLLLAMDVRFPPIITLFVTLIEFLIALGLTLWHLVSMVVSATRPLSAEIVNAVRFEIDDLLDERRFDESMRKKFHEIAGQYSWPLARFGFVGGLRDAEQRKFSLKRIGIISDIRLDALENLHNATRSINVDWSAHITLGPGDNSEFGPVLVLRRKSDSAVEDSPSTETNVNDGTTREARYHVGGNLPQLMDNDESRIAALVEKTFEVKARDAELTSDLSAVVTTIIEAAEDAAIEGKKRELKERLKMLDDLTEVWHKRTQTAAPFFELGQEGWLFYGVASTQRALSPIVRAAAASGDPELSEVIENFLMMRYDRGLERRDLSHVNEILVLIDVLYRESVRDDDEK